MISENNKGKRHDLAKICIETKDTLDDVFWSDESSVQLTSHSQTMSVKIGKEHVLKLQAKHTLMVHVWAAIYIEERGHKHLCI